MAKKFDFLSPGIEIREIDQSFIPQEAEAEGPIIIGRTRKGPANKPVKIRNLDDYVSVFGLPVPGGAGAQGDMWRDGNMTGPTYASYAAQSWLASEESPVVMVRLAGEERSDAEGFGKAGWDLSLDLTNDASTNSTAYGLFLIASSSTNQDKTGSLAAVFYAEAGAISLSGTAADGVQGDGKYTSTLVQSVNANCEFKLVVQNAAGTATDTVTFNFSRNSSNYIRTVFNTNPQLVNSTTIDSDQLKTYWLGESFAREVETSLNSLGAGEVYGIITPLDNGSKNWSDHRESAAEAESGWVISQKDAGGNFTDLFKFKSLHVGEDIQKDYMIAIEQIAESSNPTVNPWGTFTVAVKNLAGQTVERYTGCNLNPSSPDFIAARIGDQYMEWSDDDRRYRTRGEFQNKSDIIYVEVKSSIRNGSGAGLLPAGFKGPVRPKGFTLISGSTDVQTYGTTTANGSAFANAYVAGSGSGVNTVANGEYITTLTDFTGSFVFPSIPLRVSGTDGGAVDPYRVYWGIRPKISSTSNQHDPDYCDYLRRLPSGINNWTPANATDYENSFIFTLDDIVTGSNNVVYHNEGAYAAATSFTAQSDKTFGDLLSLNVRQFLMPLHGGFEGLDIKEKEPFRNSLLDDGTGDKDNYLRYSINKALDSIADPEVVPANLLLAPGITDHTITNRLVSIAESRKDVLAIVDLKDDFVPYAERLAGDTDADSIGLVSTAVSTLKSRNLDSSYASAFYPWIQISDNLNAGNLVWVPPSIAALGAFGRSQAQSDVWFAPAGFNRGGLGSLGGSRGPKVLQARQRLDSKERDLLYEVNINPIATFPAEGVVIFGQKTLQATESALNRINVRRLVLYLKSRVSVIARNLLFDQNVESTWNRFKGEVNPVLSDVRARFGLADYKLILDDTTTTADLVDRNIMYAKIYIKPARAIEYIVVDFVITRTGADFV